jgi:putative methanogenesis marker protein 7
MVLEPVMFTGGVYKHDLVMELIEDLGGYVLQKNVTQSEVILLILVPSEDMPALQAQVSELRGELVRSPLAGTEVAVVTPTLAIHHLPHTACDIAEYLRRNGAKSNMMGLARGVGREIAQINEYETALINEHDAAVFIFGNFADCIKKKEDLYRGISVPVVVTGGPEIDKKDMPMHSSTCPHQEELLTGSRRQQSLALWTG